MKRIMIAAIVAAGTLASSAAFADGEPIGMTRAQVRAELAQARKDGLFDAPDTTYPTAQLRAAEKRGVMAAGIEASDVGGADTSRVQSGRRTATAPVGRDSIYFGQ
jgi:hypothetical protein